MTPLPVIKRRNGFSSEWLFLILVMAVLVAVNIPAQWTTISTDPDFTAWGISISNRMGPDSRLYDFGNHIPVAPLSFVFLYLASGGHGTWLTESIWNQLAIMTTIVVLTGLMLTAFKRHVVFLAAFATLGLFSKCHTVLLYCSLTNLLVACLGCVAVIYARRSATPQARYLLITAGLLASMVMLSKQSIGVLTLPAAAIAIFAVPKSDSLSSRIFSISLFMASAAVSFSVFCLLMSPVVSISGMVNDVFLTGSECKGGIGEVAQKLIGFVCDVGSSVLFTILALAVACGSRIFTWSQKTEKPSHIEERSNSYLLWLVLIIPLGVAVAWFLARAQFFIFPDYNHLLVIGLVASVLAALAILLQKRLGNLLPPAFYGDECSLLGTLTIILLPAAAGYCLSEFMGWRTLLWYIDSIPFIQVALTAIVYFAFQGVASLPRQGVKVSTTILAIALIAITWQPWRIHWAEIKNCTDVWSDVAWFKGARVTTRARPLQTLVGEVRALAKPGEAVLFLPDDPNVEECFDRPRPALNCPVVYSDFYWTRYVNDDYAILQKNPPKIIIIGPRDNWLKINDEHNDSGAAKALVQRVQAELLPLHYRLADAHQITYGSGVDCLDVWVRVD